MTRSWKAIAASCAAVLVMAGAAISPADARGGFGGGFGGHMGGGHMGGGHMGAAHMGAPHFAGRNVYAGNFHGHDHGGHDHGHHRHFPVFIGGGFYDGYYPDYYDSYYGGGDCSYAYSRWQHTGSAYWRNRYYACEG